MNLSNYYKYLIRIGTTHMLVIKKNKKFLCIITPVDVRRAFLKGLTTSLSINKIYNKNPKLLCIYSKSQIL